jgi:hypothetical protein
VDKKQQPDESTKAWAQRQVREMLERCMRGEEQRVKADAAAVAAAKRRLGLK